MDESVAHKALVFSAIAAQQWCESQRRESERIGTGKLLLTSLMTATSWVNRARRQTGDSSVRLDQLVVHWTQPASSWLHSMPDEPLVERGTPTLLCEELIADAGVDPSAEVEQKIVLRVMDTLSVRDDGAKRYTEFRRFIVEHGHAQEGQIQDIALDVGLPPSSLYESIPAECIDHLNGEDIFWPCPRCSWPMNKRLDEFSCLYDVCKTAGARYKWRAGEALIGLGDREAPASLTRRGRYRLRFGLWRYTLLPGLYELDLATRLIQLSKNIEVELWPYLDFYDIDVRKGAHHWRVDVKDYSSDRALGRSLAENPPAFLTHIVVPDRRSYQVRALRQLCKDIDTVRFCTVSDFSRMVEHESSN